MSKPAILRFIVIFGLLILCDKNIASADEVFPLHESIKPNVAFWEKIYSQYESTQGIIHDSENLAIIYEIIKLESSTTVRNRRTNRRRIRSSKRKYRNILYRLADNQSPVNDDEKRILALFGENPDPKILRRACRNVRLQRGQRDRFQKGLIRSGAFIDEMREIFRSSGLPEDLAYLPHVESSFNLGAYSKFGAAGIWQFLYGTGKQYMTVDYTVDERWDPIIATRAAAKLLKYNYKTLGSWPLAITAYNHGTRSMARAKKAKGNYEAIFNEYDGRRFKFASRNFYSEFLAARKIAGDYKSYFSSLQLNSPLRARLVEMPKFVSIKDLGKHFGVRIAKLRKLNPSLREPVFRGQKYIPKGFQLRIPDAGDVEKRIAGLPPGIFKDKQKPSRFYYVRKGDVAGVIARRHGIRLQDLIWANNLNARAKIYAGQNLRIPTSEEAAVLKEKYEKLQKTYAIALPMDQNQNQRKRTIRKEKTLEKAVEELNEFGINMSVVTGNLPIKKVFKRNNHAYGIISVETGETLGHYAEWLNIKTQSLRNLNHLSFGGILRHKWQLVIPLDGVSKEEFEEKRYEFHQERQEDFFAAYKIEGVETYIIKRGDNIWSLCLESFEIPFWLVSKLNSHLNFDDLRPMQKVFVPVVEKRDDQDNGAKETDNPESGENVVETDKDKNTSSYN